MDTMAKINMHLGNLEKRSSWQIAWIKVVFAQNQVVCGVTIIGILGIN